MEPQCSCSEFWPGEGHPPECPVAQRIAALEGGEIVGGVGELLCEHDQPSQMAVPTP